MGQLHNTARWRRMAADQKSRQPLCESCLKRGRTAQATVADHVEPHRDDPDLFWTGRLQSLCKTCHDSMKQRLEKSGIQQGCGLDGLPLDPNHPWNEHNAA